MGLPSTWLIRTSPWRIAKSEPLSRSSIERPAAFRSSVAISCRGLRTCRRSRMGGTADTVVPAANRHELDERHGRHRQLELQLEPALAGADRARRLQGLEAVGCAETCPAGVIRPDRPAETLPGPRDVRVAGVDPVVPELVLPRPQPLDLERDRPTKGADPGPLRLVERPVPDRDRDPAVGIARRPRLDERTRAVAVELARQLVLAEPFQHRDRPEAGLAEVADREQPEPAMEQRRRVAALDEMVRRDPVGEGFDAAGRRAHAARDERRGPRTVVDRRAKARTDAPFGPPQRQVGPPETGDDRTEVERRMP